jgi:hypothetical protein
MYHRVGTASIAIIHKRLRPGSLSERLGNETVLHEGGRELTPANHHARRDRNFGSTGNE